MIKEYIRKVFPVILEFSVSLDKTASILDKPWVSVGTEHEREKYIFKKNHELIISREGRVEIGSWEYLDEAQSFLIRRESGKFLYNQGFLDKAVMILKVDGKEQEFLTLANQNVLPDLDVQVYLDKLRYRKHNILKVELEDGRQLEVERDYDTNFPTVGNRVTIAGQPVNDGKYRLKDDDQVVLISDSRIKAILQIRVYTYNNRTIEIEQQDVEDISEGDSVTVNGLSPVEGVYIINRRRYISVNRGKVTSVGFRKHVQNRIIIGLILALVALILLYWFFFH
jgi:hypothetical protein